MMKESDHFICIYARLVDWLITSRKLAGELITNHFQHNHDTRISNFSLHLALVAYGQQGIEL